MKNIVKRFTTLIVTGLICLTAVPTFAGPPRHDRRPGPPRHDRRPFDHGRPDRGHRHHHKSNNGWALGAGLIGGVLIGGAIANAATRPAPPPPPPPPRPAGYYQDQQRRVWVEGRWISSTDAFGRPAQVWEPGHWEVTTERVWVPAY